MALKALSALLLGLASACTHVDTPRADPPAAQAVSVAQPAPVAAPRAPAAATPPVEGADTLLSRYLARSVERDGFTPDDFAGMHSGAQPCLEEQFGDVVSAYWLARGRVLGYAREADTLRARLELLTVAAQEPRSDSAYGSVVAARLRTDTLLLKLIPDSTRHAWQICGLLSDGHVLGGYGRPENTRFRPAAVSRAMLLRQVDSIRRASGSR